MPNRTTNRRHGRPATPRPPPTPPRPLHRLAIAWEMDLYRLQLSILRSERALAELMASPRFNAQQIRVRTAARNVERRRLEEVALVLERALVREERFASWWNALTAVSHSPISRFDKYVYTFHTGTATLAFPESRHAST